MKRYGICLLLILALAAACIAAGYFATRTKAEPGKRHFQYNV